jgi:DNA-binding CsgD family transcriptional regulator
MEEDEELTQLIGEIYDAALNPSLWPGVLEKSTRFVGGSGAALFSKDATAKSGNLYYDFGTDPYYTKLYFEKYVRLDPITTGHLVADIEQPVATADLMSYDEFLETRFYREWAQPQGLVDFVSAVLDKSATSIAMFGVFRHERQGLVDETTRYRMKLIVPHIRRAVLIGKLFNLKQAEAATVFDTLDSLSAGIILVDGSGHIVHINAAAKAILRANDFLRSVGGQLVASNAAVDQSLRDAFAAASNGDDEIGVKGIALPLIAQGGDKYVAHVLPLTSGARRREGVAYTAAAALFIRKAELEGLPAPEIIAKTYNLTPTELRVLLAIVEVGGVPEVAAALGVAVTTIKTHLSRLFEKTGVNRQADLVKLVAGFSSPLGR